ncbi:MAG TPA: FAD-dependent monooxygenase [Anaerolineales bacterium]|nr:FAD-dependent monooxygenase [Anaerolineales bacterium]
MNASRSQERKKYNKVIILGASIAGLWTARALADHFEEVLVLERDHLPVSAEFRPGAPQARQFHTLLLAGLQHMQAWFPGLDEEMISAGAVPFDLIGDIRVRIGNHWLPQFPYGQKLLSCSRLLLESSIRRRLRQNPRVHIMEGAEVIGLQGDDDNRRVTGVRSRPYRGGSDNPEVVTVHMADLVVDAMGRRSQTPKWLVELGYPAPKESEVDSFLGYVTRKYKRKPNTPILLIGAYPPNNSYGGLIFPEEEDTMVALIAGYNKHYPPTDPVEFEACARHLGPEFEEALKDAEPVSQPYGYRGTSSRWLHYEELKRWPGRFVVLGDAFCGFNPVYGQGMSVAAMSAFALADLVKHSRGNLDGVSLSALRKISRITKGAWLLATSADLEWPGTQGGTIGNSPLARFGRWYIRAMFYAMYFDKAVRIRFNEVNHLIKPVSALFAPGIFLSVMKQIILKQRHQTEVELNVESL